MTFGVILGGIPLFGVCPYNNRFCAIYGQLVSAGTKSTRESGGARSEHFSGHIKEIMVTISTLKVGLVYTNYKYWGGFKRFWPMKGRKDIICFYKHLSLDIHVLERRDTHLLTLILFAVLETIFGEFRNCGTSYALKIEGKNMAREGKNPVTMRPFREWEAKMGKKQVADE